MVADFEGDLGDTLLRLEELALGGFDAAAVDVVGEREAGGFLEEAAEVRLAETGFVRDGTERAIAAVEKFLTEGVAL